MERLILIETSTALCSAAICEKGGIIAYRESDAPKSHASLTAVFIDEMLKERGLQLTDCDGVCVSMGPGSYTGLRVGVSTAKGLCFGSGLPLLAVGTLDTLVAQAVAQGTVQCRKTDGTAVEMPTDSFRHIVPMIDARRMEVYTALFSKQDGRFTQMTQTEPLVVTGESFSGPLAEGPVLFIGDGALKCADVITGEEAFFLQCFPKASSMAVPAAEAFRKGEFRDVAYFEPFYLKEFTATVSRKKLF
ncbi:MAG: tRNA (adenosine(37)-N6)-threonylcarbamoyltransferase complex dimerization subunit type 1 TsaB [Candidatus Cryptobacteroides sp.]